MQIAVVATARKLTVLCWHLMIKGEDYAFAQTLTAGPQAPQTRVARRTTARQRTQRQRLRLLPQSGPRRRTRSRRPGRSCLPHDGRGMAAEQASIQAETTNRGGGRERQQWDATLKPVGAIQRGSTPSPCVLLFARRSTTPTTARRYRGPRRAQGRSSSRALHLDRGYRPQLSGSCGGPESPGTNNHLRRPHH